MAIQSMDQLISALTTGQTNRTDWNKLTLPVGVQAAGQWYDLSTGSGNPIQNAIIGAGD